jgi:NADP-dependent 3-hydroxy acid dehydrogenase YdfG
MVLYRNGREPVCEEIGVKIASSVVIVTGASSGIGQATARLLAQGGARVALVARSKDKLATLASELPSSFPRPTDMSEPADVRKMVSDVHDHYGRIDGLVNNAGRSRKSTSRSTHTSSG